MPSVVRYAVKRRLVTVNLGRMLLASSMLVLADLTLALAENRNVGETSLLTIGENTEQGTYKDAPGEYGFSISVDGEHVSGAHKSVDHQRQTDVALEDVDVQVKFDGLEVKPVLNIATEDLRHGYEGGEDVTFVASSNYPSWISHGEVRIFEEAQRTSGRSRATVPLDRGGVASWTMPSDGTGRYVYVLRVYDQQGRFDETKPLEIVRTSRESRSEKRHATAPGVGEDRTALRNIPVYGGAVTVHGKNVPSTLTVHAFGERIPVDDNGAFVTQRILPPGDHSVDVRLEGRRKSDLNFSRDIHIPSNEWFYVGLADLTVGHRFEGRDIIETSPGEYDRTYTKGRLAFYLKGKIQGKYILTAAADTREDDLDNIFRNLDKKDPRQLLRRVDPDKYYPVYGDDSTLKEDAPTKGKFYVRLERGDSHVLWGSYKTSITGTEFGRVERGLYGAHGRYRSEQVTKFGRRRVEAEAYASQPGTLAQRDTLRGTGGSAYFLARQDITRGSERVTIEVRDPVTGIVRSRRELRYSEDYTINYYQGVIVLSQPLASTVRSTTIVQNNPLGDDTQNLIVQYEYTPALGDVKGYSHGGRAHLWVSDHVRVGGTAIKEESGPADQRLIEADVRIQIAEKSHIQAEVAESRGPGFNRGTSINGGLTIGTVPSAGGTDSRSRAYRVEGRLDLSDFDSERRGYVGAYYDRREAGFTSLDYNTAVTQDSFGAYANISQNAYLRYLFDYEDFKDDNGNTRREANAEIEYEFATGWTLGLGGKHTDVHGVRTVGTDRNNGSHTDLGARLTHDVDEDLKVYAFGHATVQRSGNVERNDRAGVGVKSQLTDSVGVEGEVSWGNRGWGALAGINYAPTADDKYYLAYRLDPSRTPTTGQTRHGTDMGNIVLGAQTRYSQYFSSYGENSYDVFGERQSIASTYGVTYTPSKLWTLGGGIEHGRILGTLAEDLERTALSATVGYKADDLLDWRLKGEVRFEDSHQQGLDRESYLITAGLKYKVDPNWRFLTNIDVVISDSNQAAVLDGDYIEGSIGYAYRPIDNDKLNALFKYTYLRDLPGIDQVTVAGTTNGPAQRSHILSVDVSREFSEYLTIGGKYGFRIGEVASNRTDEDFTRSSAHLGVLRLDMHVINDWDVFLEGRVLHTPEIDTTQYGVVAGVYRHVGDNLKIGVGYNFGRFSDDVSDLTLDDSGVFLNVVGKF